MLTLCKGFLSSSAKVWGKVRAVRFRTSLYDSYKVSYNDVSWDTSMSQSNAFGGATLSYDYERPSDGSKEISVRDGPFPRDA